MMILVKKAPEKKSANVNDPWQDWKPPAEAQRLGAEKAAWQTAAVAAAPPAQCKVRRRMVDARLWEAMRPEQQSAAVEIAAAFELLNRGLGYVASNWERLPGSGGAANVTDAQARMIKNYFGWAAECAKKKLSHAMMLDILCFGHSCRAVDRDRRLRNGAAKENLLNGLTLYCELRGWA